MMGGDEKSPTFHDFLGMSSADGGGADHGGTITGSSDLGSERQGVNNSEGSHFHGRTSAISEHEASNAVLGRKRSSSSPYVDLIRDRMLSVGSDSFENACLTKAFGKELVNERLEKSHHEDMPSSMQPPPRPTSSLLSHPPIRPDSIISRWERPIPSNPGPMNLYSRFGQSSTTLASQAAADEGSRTGMKSSGILKIVNSSSIGAGERITTGALPYSNTPKAPQIVEPESSIFPSCNNFASTSRQMTIFYAGQAHVFDDVHPNKADVIMALAGSNGASWSTNYSKLGIGVSKAPNIENELRTNNLPLSIPGISKTPCTDDLQNITPGGHAV